MKESELQVLSLMCSCVDDQELQPRGGQTVFEALFGGQLPSSPALSAAARHHTSASAATATSADVLAGVVVDL